MLITVSGTQCVGKSTLIKDFLVEYKDFSTPEIDYRKIILEQKLNLNRQGDYRSQKVLFDFVLDQSKEFAAKPGNYILDRSLLDVVAYSTWLHQNRPEAGFTDDNIAEMYQGLIKNIYLYNVIFYIPLKNNSHVKIEDDNFRDTNEDYRLEIDKIFDNIVDDLSLCKTNIYHISGTREERIEQIKKELMFASLGVHESLKK